MKHYALRIGCWMLDVNVGREKLKGEGLGNLTPQAHLVLLRITDE